MCGRGAQDLQQGAGIGSGPEGGISKVNGSQEGPLRKARAGKDDSKDDLEREHS